MARSETQRDEDDRAGEDGDLGEGAARGSSGGRSRREQDQAVKVRFADGGQKAVALLAELGVRIEELERRLGAAAPPPAVPAWDLGLLSQRVDRLRRVAELGLELALPSAEETIGSGRCWLHTAEPAPGGPRKVLLTAATGPHAELLSIALSPLHAYARRHSWSLRVVVGETPADRPAAWAKVPLIREALQEADVVCWVDSDAIVVDLSTDILDELEPGTDLYLVRHFGADPPHETPNTGVMMWRAGEWADRMLERVWSSEHLVDHPWWENAALLEILGYELEPVATTAAIPPCPAERASAAAHNRRPRSSSTRCSLKSRYRSAIARSSTTTNQFYITPPTPSQTKS